MEGGRILDSSNQELYPQGPQGSGTKPCGPEGSTLLPLPFSVTLFSIPGGILQYPAEIRTPALKNCEN